MEHIAALVWIYRKVTTTNEKVTSKQQEVTTTFDAYALLLKNAKVGKSIMPTSIKFIRNASKDRLLKEVIYRNGFCGHHHRPQKY